MSRITPLVEKYKGTGDPDDIMLEVIDALSDTVEVIPEPGNYYTFVYLAKTPNIIYDQHPLIACTSIQSWGFTGLNFHLNMPRRYTWQEVIGKVHRVYNEEIDYMKSVPYQKTILNS